MFNFGPLAAQNDKDLLKYFHTSEQALTLLDFDVPLTNFILVARPGGGKTALLKWLRARESDILTLVIQPDAFRVSLGDRQVNESDLEVLLGSELFSGILGEVANRGFGGKENVDACKEFFKNNWFKMVKNFFTSEFGGLSIFGVGFNLKPAERKSYLQKLRSGKQKEKAANVLRQVGESSKILLVVDDPELIVSEGLVATTEKNGIRLGVLLSVLAELHGTGVRVVAFAKEHILQNVRSRYGNYKQFSDQVEGVEWTVKDLLAMLELRVEKRLKRKWQSIFGCSKREMGKVILPRLINGPRDLIFLCNQAGKEEGAITTARLERGLRELRSQVFGDIASLYGREGQWPLVDQFAQGMVSVIREKFEGDLIPTDGVLTAFEEAFELPESPIHSLRAREHMEWLDGMRWDFPKADETLFVLGFLGYVYEGEKFYPWSGRSLDRFRRSEAHFLNPLFLSG